MGSKKVQACFISIAVAVATMCLYASDEDESLYKSILPRCVDFQEPEVNFFDQLESVENQIVDSLLKIHALESRLQNPPASGQCNTGRWLAGLELLKTEAENKAIVKKTFLDPPMKTVNKHEPAEGISTNRTKNTKGDSK